MFRAKLIEDHEKFYKNRKILNVALILILLMNMSSFFKPSFYITFFGFICLIVAGYLMWKSNKKLKQIETNSLIALDNRIQIRSGDEDGLDQEYFLNQGDRIVAKLPKHLDGQYHLTLNRNDRFDFIVDSQYLRNNLEEQLAIWEERGILIERV